jgi:hypothetical protein
MLETELFESPFVRRLARVVESLLKGFGSVIWDKAVGVSEATSSDYLEVIIPFPRLLKKVCCILAF